MADLRFGRLSYGGATLGNLFRVVSDDDCWEMLEAAWECGVRYFDTAPHYGLGLAERRLGAFLRTKPRDQYILSTKVGRLLRPNPQPSSAGGLDEGFAVADDLVRVWDPSAAGVAASLTESLDRLGLDRIDILYLHDPERYGVADGLARAVPALADLRSQGMVSAIGVGSMDTGALSSAAEYAELDLLMVAGRYTLAEQPVVPRVTSLCRANGIGIVAASVFNSGMLATEELTADSRYDYGSLPEAVRFRVAQLIEVCRLFDVSLPAAALQFPLRDSLVKTVVVGTGSARELAENAERVDETIPSDFWEELQNRGLIPA